MDKQNTEKSRSTNQVKGLSRLKERAVEAMPHDLPGHIGHPGMTDSELLQEFYIHQAELKKQNDELHKALSELEESRERYYDLYDRAPIGYVTLDKNGVITSINTTGLEMIGCLNTQLTGKLFSGFVAEDSRNTLFCASDSAVKLGNRERCELELVKRNGDKIWVHWECIPFNKDAPNLLEFRCSFIDISSRVESEFKLKKLNKKLLEEEQRRIYISQRLIDLLEQDRREIASYLHDHTGQILTALKMEIEELSMLENVDLENLRTRSFRACSYVNSVMKEVKNLAWSMMPVSLDILGLKSALVSFFESIEDTTDLKINFFTSGGPLHLEKRVETAIFRVAQEAVNNIIKHAQAGNVYVNLLRMGAQVSFSIEDNGVGFDAESLKKGERYGHSLGLILMEERVVQLKGKIMIDSNPGQGTRILVEIPV